MSAWKKIGIPVLPAKGKAKLSDISDRLGRLRDLFQVQLDGIPSHDQLQAVVAGLAGIAMEAGWRNGFETCGMPPTLEDGYWREGFIVNPTHKYQD